MADIRPLHDVVFIRRLDKEDVSPGGILIPEKSQQKPLRGTVIAVGPGVKNEQGVFVPTTVKVGDLVLFSKLQNTEMPVNGEKLLVIKEANILGVFDAD